MKRGLKIKIVPCGEYSCILKFKLSGELFYKTMLDDHPYKKKPKVFGTTEHALDDFKKTFNLGRKSHCEY